MRKGTKHLRIASVIQIILGIGTIAIAYFLLDKGDVLATGISGEQAFKELMLTYAASAFQIVAGLFGLILANKKSLFTVILGLLLFIPQLILFIHTDDSIPLIIVNIVFLIFPYYYLHNACKNFKKD